MANRYCKRCKQNKDAVTGFRRIDSQCCRECDDKDQRSYYLRHREQIIEYNQGYQKKHPEGLQHHYQKRQTLKRKRKTVPIRKRVIFERDGWVCQICGEPVDPALLWPDPLSKSLDHIIPLSAGGTHTPDNLQLTHLVCNLRKRTLDSSQRDNQAC